MFIVPTGTLSKPCGHIPGGDLRTLPDGKVAVIRAADYHVDYFSTNRAKTSGPAIAYEKIKVDDAVKKQVEADRAKNSRNAVRMTVDAGGRGGAAGSRNHGTARRSRRRARGR